MNADSLALHPTHEGWAPWAPAPLWFVPTEADVEALAHEGIHWGRIWTAAELRDLLAIPGISKAQARLIAETKVAFEGDTVVVESKAGDNAPAGTPAKPVASPTWSGWPAAVSGLGSKRVGPFTACSVCGTGIWVVYGQTPRCWPCATVATADARPQDTARPEG